MSFVDGFLERVEQEVLVAQPQFRNAFGVLSDRVNADVAVGYRLDDAGYEL